MTKPIYSPIKDLKLRIRPFIISKSDFNAPAMQKKHRNTFRLL